MGSLQVFTEQKQSRDDCIKTLYVWSVDVAAARIVLGL